MAIREAILDDSVKLPQLYYQLSCETPFMLLTPEENMAEAGNQEAKLRALIESPYQHLLVADMDRDIIGFIVITRGRFERNLHVAQVVMGVLKQHWGTGVAQDLMREALTVCRNNGIRRVELTVIEENLRAISLYQKMGFHTEGRRNGSIRHDNAYLSELYMAKLIN